MTDELVFKVVENFYFHRIRTLLSHCSEMLCIIMRMISFYHFTISQQIFFSSLNKCLVKRGLSSSQRWDRCSLILSFPDLFSFFPEKSVAPVFILSINICHV